MGRKKLVSDEQLLAAARRFFVEKGMAASTRDIAREAGVSEGLLFQRYATEGDLFLAAMVPPVFDLNAYLPEDLEHHDGERIIRDLFLALLDYFRLRGAAAAAVDRQPRLPVRAIRRSASGQFVQCAALVADQFLARLKAAGKMDADPRWAALALFTATHGIAYFELMGAHGGRFNDEMVEATAATLWRGFRPATTR